MDGHVNDPLDQAWIARPDLGLDAEVEENTAAKIAASFTVTPAWLIQVARATGDYNSIHNPSDTARAARGGSLAIAHGVGLIGLVSGLITEWAGPGATAINIGTVAFGRPVQVDIRIYCRLSFAMVDGSGKRQKWRCDGEITNEAGSRKFMTIAGAEFLKPAA